MESVAESILKTKPELNGIKEKLAALMPGTYCIHRTWGVGCIKSFNEATGKLTIDFEGDKASHEMDPAFCATKLEILPETHIISRHRKNPADVQALIDSNPAELFIQILSSAPNQTMSTIEMETTLQHLMGDHFKKWLTNVKKRLAKDSRISLGEKKGESYSLRSEPVAADDEVLVAFYKTKNVKKKIELAETLLAHQPLPQEVCAKLSSLVEELAAAIADSRVLTAGEKLQGAWVRDDLAKLAAMDGSKFNPVSADLIKESFSLQELTEQLPAQYLRRMLDVLKENQADEWQKVAFDLLRGSSGKFTQECVTFLLDNDCGQKLAETLDRWLGEQSLKAPMIIWIIKNRTARRYSTMLSRLMTPNFFSAILYAIDNEAIQNASPKRIALVELLLDDKDLIPELLATATPEVARDLAHTLLMNQGFETLTKRSLIARFIKQFPDVQSLIASDETKNEQENLIVSWESLEKRKAEYQLLVTKKIPENKEAIAIAREHGDLSENSEYKMARQDRDTLMALKAQMETELRIARGTDFTDASSERVSVGNVVELQNSKEKTTYTILGAWDGNPDKNILSYKTPLAQALLGKKEGESVSFGGQDYKVLAIRVWTKK